MTAGKTIGFVFIEGFADWEYGLLSASAVEWFGARAVSLSPGGCAGVIDRRLSPDARPWHGPAENTDLDAVAVIGSDSWTGETPPDVSALLKAVADRGGVVGGICAGTLALARAGLFEDVAAHQQRPRLDLEKQPRLCRRRALSGCAACSRGRAHRLGSGLGARHLRARFLQALYPEQERSSPK